LLLTLHGTTQGRREIGEVKIGPRTSPRSLLHNVSLPEVRYYVLKMMACPSFAAKMPENILATLELPSFD
jgi:hypothetical protein